MIKFKLERKHTCDGDVTIAHASVTICRYTSIEDACDQALDVAYSAQAGVFGDTGMDDGEYEVRITSINIEYKTKWSDTKRP